MTRSLTLVTGGAGFIGSHVAEALLEAGHTVRVLDNLSTGKRENLPAGVEFHEGDVSDLEAWRRALAGVGLCFHLAAFVSVPKSFSDPERCWSSNVASIFHLLRAGREAGLKRVVFTSSCAVYPDSAEALREEMPVAPPSPYGLSKREGEELLRLLAPHQGLEWAALRYFNVFGPRQDPNSPYAAVVPIFFARALAREPLVIYGDGAQTRDFVFVRDVARANLLAAEHAPSGTVLNVASGVSRSVLEIAAHIRALAPHDPGQRFDPSPPGNVRASRADTSRLEAVLGWRPDGDFEQALAVTAAWYRERC